MNSRLMVLMALSWPSQMGTAVRRRIGAADRLLISGTENVAVRDIAYCIVQCAHSHNWLAATRSGALGLPVAMTSPVTPSAPLRVAANQKGDAELISTACGHEDLPLSSSPILGDSA